MASWLGRIGLAALWIIPALGAGMAMAATSPQMDILTDETVRSSADTIDVDTVRPIAKPAQPASKPIPRGNPLWSVPLSALTATEERPIFSAARRPPPRAVAASPAEQASAPPPPKPAEDPPPLVLVGAVVGEGDAIAILMDRTDQKVIRMRQGETRAGWSLSSVHPREFTFKHGERSEVLALRQLPAVPAGAAAVPPGTGGKLTTPAAGDTSFAPFVPRSTRKGGESDGL
jgi:general secretion pathway protein N